MRAFQEVIKRYQEANVQVLGISKDDIDSHKRFAQENNLSFPLVSDTEGKMAAEYGAFKTGGSFFARRTVVIDKAGKVRYVQNGMPNPENILKVISELK